jgi:hypothetical protein
MTNQSKEKQTNLVFKRTFMPSRGFQLPPSNLLIPGVVNDPSVEGTASMSPSGFSTRVGGEFRWSQFNLFQLQSPRGTFDFTGQFSNNPKNSSGGNGLADMLLGLPLTSFIDSLVYLGNRQHVPSLFVQDDFKVTSHLTLNLGLRWEYYSPLVDVHNHQANFDYSKGQLLVAGQNGNSDALTTAQKANFAPRVGFAYSPFNTTVLRGAYGIFYSGQEIRTGDPLQLAYNLPFYYQPTFIADGIHPLLTLAKGFPALNASQAINPGVSSVDTNTKTPYYQEWNFAIQRLLPGNITIEGAYAGTKGVHLQMLTDQNQDLIPGPGDVQARAPYPTFGPFASIQMRGNSKLPFAPDQG